MRVKYNIHLWCKKKVIWHSRSEDTKSKIGRPDSQVVAIEGKKKKTYSLVTY